ncbi:hypothetical protein [Endozoicomonas atrinae]|uniref:hypothetical protein n=1 Tax=Endozoicomonas atrinae TaxID=1333660 RepID=UPI000825F696|nr:hypothetical protein [Endozoicomonas atrinae]
MPQFFLFMNGPMRSIFIAIIVFIVSIAANAVETFGDWIVNDNGVSFVVDNSTEEAALVYVPAQSSEYRDYTYISRKDVSCFSVNKDETELVLRVNDQPVKFIMQCSDQIGFMHWYPTTAEGDAFVIQQLKTKMLVDIQGTEFSAHGFTDAFNYLDNSGAI